MKHPKLAPLFYRKIKENFLFYIYRSGALNSLEGRVPQPLCGEQTRLLPAPLLEVLDAEVGRITEEVGGLTVSKALANRLVLYPPTPLGLAQRTEFQLEIKQNLFYRKPLLCRRPQYQQKNSSIKWRGLYVSTKQRLGTIFKSTKQRAIISLFK